MPPVPVRSGGTGGSMRGHSEVHRLLATRGVDERMVKMLKNKTRLFDAYARRSAVAESTPDAVDVSDTAMARQIVEEEQARLGAVRKESAGHP